MPEDPIPPNSPITVLSDSEAAQAVDFSADHAVSPGGDRAKSGSSSSFVWSCTEWDETGQDRIVQIINPASVRWNIPFRRSRTNAFGGTVIYDWQAPDGSSLDLPTLTITMQTGGLYPLSFFADQKQKTSGPVQLQSITSVQKRQVFYRFCELTATPAFTTSGKPNIVTLDYHTILFPDVKMQVKFLNQLSLAEEARNPFNVEYTIDVVVLKMVPPLSALSELATQVGTVL